jgi:hypothetical protein
MKKCEMCSLPMDIALSIPWLGTFYRCAECGHAEADRAARTSPMNSDLWADLMLRCRDYAVRAVLMRMARSRNSVGDGAAPSAAAAVRRKG